MKSDFFETNSFFIDEKVNFLKFENSYQVFNDKGVNIGSVRQKLSIGQKLLRLLLNKALLPFMLEIKNSNERVEASLSRGWTFWMSTILIKDSNDIKIGSIQQKFRLFKPTFIISNKQGQVIAEISGDWKAWNFTIKDPNNKQLGSINKKWAGAMQEIFTSADKYNVNIDPSYPNKEDKIAILSAAITIDMILKEKK